jgi:hypothetical protein
MMEVFKSVVKTTLTSTMIAISVVRIAMIAYPSTPSATQISTGYAAHPPAIESQITTSGTKRRIVLGRNSIENLGKTK